MPQAVQRDGLQRCEIFCGVDLHLGHGVSNLDEPAVQGADSIL